MSDTFAPQPQPDQTPETPLLRNAEGDPRITGMMLAIQHIEETMLAIEKGLHQVELLLARSRLATVEKKRKKNAKSSKKRRRH
jgi:hypothetical protein